MKQCEHLAPNAQTAANAIATDTALGQMVARLASLSPDERSEAAIEADFLLNAAADTLDCLADTEIAAREREDRCFSNRQKLGNALGLLASVIRLVLMLRCRQTAAECWPEITQGGRNVRKTLAAPVSCSCRCCGRARPLRWVYRSPDLLAVEAEA